MVLVGLAIWTALHFLYRHRIESLKDEVEALRRRQTDVPPRQPVPAKAASVTKHKPYDALWEKHDSYTLWQAAWLWVGLEPVAQVPAGSKAYPVFAMLKDAISRYELRAELQGLTANMHARVSKDDLRGFAASKNEAPVFLFGGEEEDE